MVDHAHRSRTVLIIGSALLAGGLAEGPASAQTAPPAGATAAPWFPACVVKAPTDCKLPDGHPDLTGLWSSPAPSVGGGGGNLADGSAVRDFGGRKGNFNFEADGALYRESNVDSGDSAKPNWPMYKPEFWDQITDNEYNGNFNDPLQHCMPETVPRVGPPSAIVALPGLPFVQLLYNDPRAFGVRVRMVPTDGRGHHDVNVAAETWSGDPVGRWEGNTLVVETIGFTDATWLHKNGYIHGFDMKVTERFTRNGNDLRYEAVVDDPEYFIEPWKQTPRTLKLNVDPKAILYEPLPCIELDNEHTTGHVRSG